MEIKHTEHNSIQLVEISGRLDASSCGELESLFNQLNGEGKVKVLLDCAQLEYISSAGLRVLLASAKIFKKASGAIDLCTLNPNVKQVFEISGFTNIFDIHENQSEGLESLS